MLKKMTLSMESARPQGTAGTGNKLSGVLDVIRYHQSNFLIGVLKDGSVVKGNIVSAQVGMEYSFTGKWEHHAKWGPQFGFDGYSTSYPRELESVRAYLEENCKWIGPKASKMIVQEFGAETLNVCKTSPEKVAEVINGVTLARANEVSEMLLKNEKSEKMHLDLKDLLGGTKISRRAIGRIVDLWGAEAPGIIRENPYLLVEFIKGIGFPSADEVAKNLGYDHEGPPRIKAGLIHTLKDQAFMRGHTCLPKAYLLGEAAKLLLVPMEKIDAQLGPMQESGVVINHRGVVQLKSYNLDETLISEMMKMLVRRDAGSQAESPDMSGLMEDQVDALDKAIKSGVFILTGAPGTGKTFLIGRIIDSFPKIRLALAAPTGKAARRMSEQSGRPAKTMHKLLDPKMVDGNFVFRRNKRRPIEADIIVLDEVSMVDTWLMARFLDAVAPGTRLVFVGDTHQLPSIGAGNVLNDLIECGLIPFVELTIIKRQNPGLIVRNCFAGETPVLTRKGLRPIRELNGEVDVLSEGGVYRPAQFQSYGEQKLLRVELTTGEVLFATPDHEWIIDMQHGVKRRVPTHDLEGKYLPINLPLRPERNEEFATGVQHGIVYGDGSRIKRLRHCEVYLFGPKRGLVGWLDQAHIGEQKNGSIRGGVLPWEFKDLPLEDASASYWYGFICGLVATDGNVGLSGRVEIDQAKIEPLLAVQRHAGQAGMLAHATRTINRPDPFTGQPRQDYRISLRKGTLCGLDLIREDHRERFLSSQKRGAARRVGVRSVRATNRIEEVFCCVEPETHTMTVGSGYLTGQCHHIKNGEDIEVKHKEGEERDFLFIEHEEEMDAHKAILELVCHELRKRPNCDILRDVQVIAPLRKRTGLSCEALNAAFQEELNPGPEPAGTVLRVGDKVIQTRNNYELDVINGDIGFVEEIDRKNRKIKVAFSNPDRLVEFALWENDLQLAYAVTVHKFQGSEARVIVVPIHKCLGAFIMQRNLLYTAISRAKSVCVLVGQRSEIPKIIKRNHQQRRHTRLREMLQQS